MQSAGAVSSSPTGSSKTHAFFTSSFAVTPPPPRPPPSPKKRVSDASQPTQPSSPTVPTTTRSIFSPTSLHISRIFPSRHSASVRDSSEAHDIQSASRLRRKPELISLDQPVEDILSDSIESTHGYAYNSFTSYGRDFRGARDDFPGISVPLPSPAYGFGRDRGVDGDGLISSASSSASSSSSHVSIRLPTPPPPPLLTPSMDTASPPRMRPSEGISGLTPRPSSCESPPGSSFLRPFIPEPISKAPSMISTSSTNATEDDHADVQDAGELHEGDIITPSLSERESSSPVSPTSSNHPLNQPILRLTRPLGQGAFSAVWLAEDLSPVSLALSSKRSVRDLKRQGTLSRNGSIKGAMVSRKASWGSVSRHSSLKKLRARLTGTKPVGAGKEVLDEHQESSRACGSSDVEEDSHMPCTSPSPVDSPKKHQKSGSGASLEMVRDAADCAAISSAPGGISLSRRCSTKRKPVDSSSSRLVAVKLTPRRPVEYSPLAQERTRIGFVREVEVLRHISHPNITPLLSFLSTPTHHVLVLPYLRGGDLLSLVNDDRSWNNLSEGVMRRIWCEICRGVGWMHSVGLVHRDVKLENVLVTWEGIRGWNKAAEDDLSPMPDAERESGHQTARVSVDDLPTPLIKLTDFGLSRFIDIGNGERGHGELLTTRCGSEAYAAPELVMGSSYASSSASSPPRKGVYDARETDAWACGVVLYALVGRRLPFGEGAAVDGQHIGGERVSQFMATKNGMMERRKWLMRIAKGEWEWPEAPVVEGDEEELVGPTLPRCEGARRVVSRLLVRDPRKRARIVDLWEDEWMRGDVVGNAMYESLQELHDGSEGVMQLGDGLVSGGLGEVDSEVGGEGEWDPLPDDSDEDVESDYFDADDEMGDGWLLDEEHIDNIARQEVV